MSKRGPMELLERYGRQLLIDGHAIEAQQQLAEWAVVPASDDSDVAAHLVEVATMYLVGAGLGRVAGRVCNALPKAPYRRQVRIRQRTTNPNIVATQTSFL